MPRSPIGSRPMTATERSNARHKRNAAELQRLREENARQARRIEELERLIETTELGSGERDPR